MTSTRLLMIGLGFLAGCVYSEPRPDVDLACPSTDAKPSTSSDMAVAPPKCAAAAGLAGTNLLCVDFKDVQMLSSLTGWDFTCTSGASWVSSGGKLQVNNFSTFMSTCSATLPALTASDYQKYSSFTLAVVQTVDVNATKQNTAIYLGVAQPSQAIHATAGTYPRQRNIYEIAKQALPNGGSNTYQPLFQVNSTVAAGGTAQGWQIESIAINGVQ